MEENFKTLFSNLVEGENYLPSPACEKAFSENFEDAQQVEWAEYEDHSEAIFYKDALEHVSLFSKDGILLEYRKALPEGFLPYAVRKDLETRGEIMNRVLINKGNSIQYEVILRDKKLDRYLLLFSDIGEKLKEKKL
jgi:hypothetical protein